VGGVLRLEIKFQYEPEGYHLPSGDYPPDFYLPELQTFVEVKPGPGPDWPKIDVPPDPLPREAKLGRELVSLAPPKTGFLLVYGDPIDVMYDTGNKHINFNAMSIVARSSDWPPRSAIESLTRRGGITTGPHLLLSEGLHCRFSSAQAVAAAKAARAARFEHGERP
jgi:hypothetical protein